MIYCECGCGNEYPEEQIVVRKIKTLSIREYLYIPHAIEVLNLFRPPSEIRAKLDQSMIETHDYILPGDDCYPCALQNHIHPSFVRREDPRYGPYWVRNVPRGVTVITRDAIQKLYIYTDAAPAIRFDASE